jgi:acetylornithine deacetylase
MKGFLACALALAERAGKVPLSSPISLSISYDEEMGCVGIQEMMPELRKIIGKPRLVIVGEPTSMKVATGHKGKTALAVTCHVQAGHSALAPNFVNAIHVAADFIQELRDYQDRLIMGSSDDGYSVPYSTVHIGQISGGRALNIVPAATRLDIEFRHLAGYACATHKAGNRFDCGTGKCVASKRVADQS